MPQKIIFAAEGGNFARSADILKFYTKRSFLKLSIRILSPVYFICFFLYFHGNKDLFAQNYLANVQFYNYENGLAGRFVNYTFRDSRGIIWVGTQFGLNRFDGRDFLTFNEASGLLFNQVMEIHEDSEGWLWLFRTCFGKQNCIRNLQFFHSVTHEVRSFEEHFGEQVDFRPKDVLSILSEEKEGVFVSAADQVIQWKKGEVVRKLNFPQPENTPILLNLVGDNKLAGWYHADDSLGQAYLQYLVFDFEGNMLHEQRIANSNRVKSLDALQMNGKDSRGRNLVHHNYRFHASKPQFVLEENGMLTRDTTSWINFSPLQYLHHNPFRLEAWTVNEGGPIVYSPDRGVVYRFKDYPELQKLLYVRHVHFDQNDVVWLSGRYGLLRIQLSISPFRRILHNARSDLESPGKQICQDVISIDEDRLLLLTQAAIFEIKERTRVVRTKVGNWNRIPSTFTKGYKDHFWGMKSGVLHKLKTKGGQYEMEKTYFKDQVDFKDVSTQHFEGNRLWMGTDKGLHYYDFATHQIFELDNYNRFEELKNQIIHHIYKESENRIWLCASEGVYLFSPQKGVLERYWENGKNHFKIPGTSFYQIHPAQGGGWWLASQQGLIYWNPNENTARHYTVSDGLPTNEILGVHEDEYGFLWLPTNVGLIQFHVESAHSKQWLEVDGISSNDFEPYSYFAEADGTLWFGTTNGYTVFHPRDFKDIDPAARVDVPLNILSFEQFSDETKQLENRTKDILNDSKILLNPGEQLFNLRVALADYVTGKDALYSYRIKGVQDFWQEDKENLIRISGLPYGNFTLEIRGRLANGQYSSNEIHLPIQVLRPFYFKSWFLLVLISSLFIGFFLWYQWRTRQLKKQRDLLENAVKERTKTIEEQAEELRNLDKLKSRFFANVSHELRTPLTLMLAPIDSALKSQQLNDRNNTFLNIAKQSGQKLLNLVNEILDLTKIESGKLELNLKAANLHTLTQRIVTSFESYSESKQLKLALDYQAPQSLQIEVDIKKYEAILNNLLSNAFKFTHPGGKVTVVLQEKGDKLQLSVADTGRGIHADDLPHVFDRFYQTKRPDAVADGGTGIGLALCSELAKCFGGKLWVESEEGQGSTFYFEFPRRGVFEINAEEIEFDEAHSEVEEPDLSSLPAQNGIPASISKDRTILIVEDNAYLRDYLKTILDKYTVVTVNNGKEALDWLAADGGRLKTETEEPPHTPTPRTPTPRTPTPRTPHLIISDVMMPQMDGFQLLNKLKTNEKYRHIPVLMLTARAGKDDKLKALRIGVDDYMTKPFEQEELFVRVENMLRNNLERQKQRAETKSVLIEASDNETNHSSEELIWLEATEALVKKHLVDPKFNTQALADKLQISRIHLFRRLKNTTGLSPSQYIKEARLVQARQLIENQTYDSIKAVAYSVGMHHLGSFASQFKARFGKSPSAFQASNGRSTNTLS